MKSQSISVVDLYLNIGSIKITFLFENIVNYCYIFEIDVNKMENKPHNYGHWKLVLHQALCTVTPYNDRLLLDKYFPGQTGH